MADTNSATNDGRLSGYCRHGSRIVDAADDVDRAFDEEHDGSHQRTYDGKEGGEASAVEELFEKECLPTFEVQKWWES